MEVWIFILVHGWHVHNMPQENLSAVCQHCRNLVFPTSEVTWDLSIICIPLSILPYGNSYFIMPIVAYPSPVQNKCELQNSEIVESSVPQFGLVADNIHLLSLKHSTDLVNCLQSGEQSWMGVKKWWIATFKKLMSSVKPTFQCADVGSTSKYIRQLDKLIEISSKR